MAAVDLTTSVAELVGEAVRRLAIADRIEEAIQFGPNWSKIPGLPDPTWRSDGCYEVRQLEPYAAHMRSSAAVYATLADVVSRQHPHSPHAEQVRDALAAGKEPR